MNIREKINFMQVSKFVVNRSNSRYDVYIGRPSPWGNPYSTHATESKIVTDPSFIVETRDEAIQKFYESIDDEFREKIKRELKGKVLGCWCHPKFCHGHVLAWIANFE